MAMEQRAGKNKAVKRPPGQFSINRQAAKVAGGNESPHSKLAAEKPLLFVVAGDSRARRSLSLRLKQFGCDMRLCHSPEEFQRQDAQAAKEASPHDAGCILLHLAHPQQDLDWLTTLGPKEHHWPVIAIAPPPHAQAAKQASPALSTAECWQELPLADRLVAEAVMAMKRGARDFLLESCSDQRLRVAVEEALAHDAIQRRHIARVQAIRRRLKQLPPPLCDVLDLLLHGKTNGEIACELGMSVRSIEVRRAKVMQTMRARSLAALVRDTLMARGLGPKLGEGGGAREASFAASASCAQIARPPR